LVAVIVALLATPATAAMACPPAVDQYTEHLPGAGSCGRAGGDTPVARSGLLPDSVLAALSGRDGRLLAQIATARDLGAPAVRGSAGEGTGTAEDGRAFPVAAAATVGTAPALALFAALGVIALAGAWTWYIRRSRSPAELD
jgi:hypothetical protein